MFAVDEAFRALVFFIVLGVGIAAGAGVVAVCLLILGGYFNIW